MCCLSLASRARALAYHRGPGRHSDWHANTATGRHPGKAMAQNVYGHGVRMGNWNEDVYLEEVKRWLGGAPAAQGTPPQACPRFPKL